MCVAQCSVCLNISTQINTLYITHLSFLILFFPQFIDTVCLLPICSTSSSLIYAPRSTLNSNLCWFSITFSFCLEVSPLPLSFVLWEFFSVSSGDPYTQLLDVFRALDGGKSSSFSSDFKYWMLHLATFRMLPLVDMKIEFPFTANNLIGPN